MKISKYQFEQKTIELVTYDDFLQAVEDEISMYNYDDEVLEVFLENQEQLFPEPVAETPEEAEEFLEDCMAVVAKNMKEVRNYFEDQGADISGMSNDELKEASEVFALPSGRFLIVEA